MYWVSDDMIYVAKLDGTDSRVFLRLANSRFDGMVIDVRRDRLHLRVALFYTFKYDLICSVI